MVWSSSSTRNWDAEILLIADKTAAELSSRSPVHPPTRPPTCRSSRLKIPNADANDNQKAPLQVLFSTGEASASNYAACENGSHLRLAVTCRICTASERLFPLTRGTTSICLPRLICHGLSAQRLHQKDAGNLKAPSLLSISLSFAPIVSSCILPRSDFFVVVFQPKIGCCKHFVSG